MVDHPGCPATQPRRTSSNLFWPTPNVMYSSLRSLTPSFVHYFRHQGCASARRFAADDRPRWRGGSSSMRAVSKTILATVSSTQSGKCQRGRRHRCAVFAGGGSTLAMDLLTLEADATI